MDEKSGNGQESREVELKEREVRVKEREIKSAFAMNVLVGRRGKGTQRSTSQRTWISTETTQSAALIVFPYEDQIIFLNQPLLIATILRTVVALCGHTTCALSSKNRCPWTNRQSVGWLPW
jgi:bisphosphoglycerate-independent phosphoglycerate mutase (AlkP superfamily)